VHWGKGGRRYNSGSDGYTYKFFLNDLSDDNSSTSVDYEPVAPCMRDAGIERKDAEFHQPISMVSFSCSCVMIRMDRLTTDPKDIE
jgi:hypothetical protein